MHEYEILTETPKVLFSPGKEAKARWASQIINKAGIMLARLLDRPMPMMDILLVAYSDWENVSREDRQETDILLPYWTDETTPPRLVIPEQLDPLLGESSPQKLAFLLFHELVHAFLEADPRPWPDESPLWADEWQMQFGALWLSQQIDGLQGIVMKDLHEKYAEIFEPEEDGKTPVTVRGFDWYEDTTPEEYLVYDLLLEQFAADLLNRYGLEILPKFLMLYRKNASILLSDEVTDMLATALGPGGVEWLDTLVYF